MGPGAVGGRGSSAGRGRLGDQMGAIYFTIKSGVQTSAEQDSGTPRGPLPTPNKEGWALRGQRGGGRELGFSLDGGPWSEGRGRSLSFSVTLSAG